MRYLRKVLASLRKADELFSLIEDGDHIALGISGGKDSLCLLMAMSIYTKFSKKDFKVVPICLDLGFPGFDPKPMQEYAESLGLKLIVEDSREVYPILQSHVKKEGHLPCSICSRMKKAAINAAAKKYGCKKVAFAHHKDDAVETLFMNMIHGGKVNTFEPMMHLEKADITFIRPFILVGEDDLIGMAKEENLPVMDKVCPADGYTERQYTKELLASIYKDHPEAEENFSSMLYDYEGARLYFNRIQWKASMGKGYAFSPLLYADKALEYQEFAKKNDLPSLKKGETHYLILRKGKLLGSISFHKPRAHELLITGFEFVGDKKDEKDILLSFLKMEAKKENPLLFIKVARGRARLFKEVGFEERLYESKPRLGKKITNITLK